MYLKNKIHSFLQKEKYKNSIKREFEEIILSITNDKLTIKDFKDRIDYYYKEIIKKLKKNFLDREVLSAIAYDFLMELDLSDAQCEKYRFTTKELYSSEELYCKIIQLSQEKELTQQELADKLGYARGAVTRQAIAKYTTALREGHSIMGTTISLNLDRRDTSKVYSSSIHPAFMALNLSEVYALTIGLKGLSDQNQDNPMSRTYEKISERLYSQLTDYGKRIINSRAEELGFSFSKGNYNHYYDERHLPMVDRILYYLKSGEDINLIYNLRGEAINYQGKITPSKDPFEPMFLYKGEAVIIKGDNILEIVE
ncbi:MAG: hypothetical protein ACI33K_04705 [Clostridiaceae bacterium]